MSTIEWIVYFFDLLPILVFLFFVLNKQKVDKPIWVILFYCVYSFCNNSKLFYDYFHHNSSTIVLYTFTIVEFCLFTVFLYTILKSRLLKKVLWVVSALFIGFCFINLFFEAKLRFDSLPTSIECLILLIFSILYLYEQINKPEVVFIYSSYKFWIVLGILIYLATSFFLYVFAASLPLDLAKKYWFINNISNILRNVLFAIALIVYVKTPKAQRVSNQTESGYQPFLN